MEVRHRQQLGLARLHPFAGLRALALRTMPIAATVVGDLCVAAGLVLATRDVPAETRSTRPASTSWVDGVACGFMSEPRPSGELRQISFRFVLGERIETRAEP